MSIVEIPVIVEFVRSEDGTIIRLKIRPTSIDPYKIESAYSGGIITVGEIVTAISCITMTSGKTFFVGVSYEALCAWLNTWCQALPSTGLSVSADEFISAFNSENTGEVYDNNELSDTLW